MPTSLVVAVGSRNPVKVNAARNAFSAAFGGAVIECHGYDVPSGVSDQPWGEQETRAGSLERAQAAHTAHCSAHGGPPDYAVGLEGGAVEERLGDAHPGVAGLTATVSCFAFMAVLALPAGGATPRWGIARTAYFPLPPRVVDLMRGSPPLELGDATDAAFAQVNSKQKGGAIGKVTNGLIDRTPYYEHALCCALAPFMHEGTGVYDATPPA